MSDNRTKQVMIASGSAYELQGTLTGAISLLTSMLARVPKEYRDEAALDLDLGEYINTFEAYYWREESDDERHAREQYEGRSKTEFESRERTELARLKAKYEASI